MEPQDFKDLLQLILPKGRTSTQVETPTFEVQDLFIQVDQELKL
jgi:hypothetical protein